MMQDHIQNLGTEFTEQFTGLNQKMPFIPLYALRNLNAIHITYLLELRSRTVPQDGVSMFSVSQKWHRWRESNREYWCNPL